MQQYTLMMVLFLALLLCDLFYYLDAKKCYVCGPSPHELFENLNLTIAVNNCTDLDNLWYLKKDILAKETFGKECSDDYKSCLLQKDGNRKITIRSCEKLELNDCQKANNVSYCYCTKDYCNHENVPNQPQILTSKDRRQHEQQQQKYHSISDEINDDEDLNDDEEASGSKENVHRENYDLNRKTSDKSKTKNSSASNKPIPLFLTSNEILFGILSYLCSINFNNIIRIS